MRIGKFPTTILCSRMLRNRFLIKPDQPPVEQASALLSRYSFSQPKYRSLSSVSHASASSVDQIGETLIGFPSSDCSGIVKSVVYSHLIDGKKKFQGASLKALLLDVSHVVPDVSRSLRRNSELKAEDVLELLLAFESETGKIAVGGDKVEALWEIFRWASKQEKGFKHIPRSYEVMASMLIREGLLDKVELLFADMENQGVLLDNNEIFSDLIQSYVSAGNQDRAVSLFGLIRARGLLPSLSCYRAVIDLLIRMQRSQLACQVSFDLVSTGMELNDTDLSTINRVIELLCVDGKIQEARDLLRKIAALGFEPKGSTISQIARGYCEKQDFEDLLNFYAEMRYRPDVLTGNKILNDLCRKFGVETANLFRYDLESLGFRPNEITLGILIGWSCRAWDLKNSFVFLSEMQSRGLKPDVHSYNALIAGVLRKGMWESASLIVDELIEIGETPQLSTYMILLAGNCKARRFEEAKTVVKEILQRGVARKSSLDDPLSQAFSFLGFDHLKVRLKRDNGDGVSKAEFTDHLGNGLYLDTDLDEYDKRLNSILDASMLPDFNMLIMSECDYGNLRTALDLIDKMVQWGQELSCEVFSALLRGLCSTRSQVKVSSNLFDKWPKLVDQLDPETLNYLVKEYSKKKLLHQGMLIFNRMVLKGMLINSETYTALLNGLCKKDIVKDLQKCLGIARINRWLPNLDQCEALWDCLCRKRMLKEALELFECMSDSFPHLKLKLCNTFLGKLSMAGYTYIVHASVEELQKQGVFLDHEVYCNLIKGLCEERNLAASFLMLDNMLALNIAPSLDDILVLIPQFCKANKFEKAIALAETSLGSDSVGSSTIYSCLIEGFCTAGNIAGAQNLLRRMLSGGCVPNDDIFNMLIQANCQAKHPETFLEVLGVMIRRDSSISISSYRNFVRSMCSEGKFSLALSLKEFLLQQNKLSSLATYNILVFYLLRSRNCLLLKRVLNELEERGVVPDEITYNFLVHGFSLCKDFQNSTSYLSEMIAKGLRPNNRSLRMVVSSLCSHGELRTALEIYKEIESKGWLPGSVIQNVIAEALLSSGELVEAESFLGRIQEKDLIPNSINYDNLIRRFCSLGRPRKGINLLNTMLKKGNVPDSTTYDSLIQALCACNSPVDALDFHVEMLDRGLKPSVRSWDILIRKFCHVGQAGDAEKLLRSMAKHGETPSREMYITLIDRYRSESYVGKVIEIMQLMQQSGYEPDFGSHWSLISKLSSFSERKGNKDGRQGFLSSLLSGCGFSWGKDSKTKPLQ